MRILLVEDDPHLANLIPQWPGLPDSSARRLPIDSSAVAKKALINGRFRHAARLGATGG
ncbi:MAG: hypothetical protein V3V55_00620 [Rhodospirillales bacterium]